MNKKYNIVPLCEVMTHYQDYIDKPEPITYPKLSVKLYGKGAVLDTSVEGSSLKMKKHQIAKKGQVILSEIWGKKGAIGIVPPEGDGALCTSHFFLFDVRDDKIEQKYLQAIFTANYLEEQLNVEAQGTTGYAAVRPKHLLAATIPLPPIEEQRRIVARIEELAAKIEEARGLRREAVEEREYFNRVILQKLFNDLNEYKETTIETVCASIIDNLHSNPIYADGGIACVRSPDVGWGKLYLASALKTTEDEYIRRTVRGEPQKDDIIFVREGGGTGKAAIVEEGQRFSLGQRVMMFRLDKNKVVPKFFLYQLLSPLVYERQIVPQSKGSASPHLNIGALRNFSFILPSLDKQQELVNQINGLQLQIRIIEKQQEEVDIELNALLPSILDKAFKGEL